jgi:D-alanyl-D-alanine carboxypeptidase (penicillin-binding protein 5/6)
MLLPSSNDAAAALAEHVAGSSSAFVSLMNRTATELGLRDTSFASPSGFDTTGYSTAFDMAALTRVAMRDPEFAEIVRTYEHRLPAAPSGPRVVQNRNLLLWYYPGAIGVKTGYLAAAGHCLVAAADRDGTRLVTVVLGHPDTAFGDGALLLDYGYRGFERRTVIRIRQPVGTVRAGGRTVPAVSGGEVSALVSIDPPGRVVARLRPRSGLSPPVRPGARVGRIDVLVDGRRVVVVPAVAGGSSPQRPAQAPGASSPPAGDGADELLRAVGILTGVLREMADAFL